MQENSTTYYALLGINIVLIQSSLFCNITLAIVLYLKRHTLANKVPLSFLRNLLMAQMLISFFSFFTEIDFAVHSRSFHQFTVYTHSIYDSFLTATNLSYTAINLDRYIIIKHPLRYNHILSERRILFISLCTFIFPSIILLISIIMLLVGSKNAFLVTSSLALSTMLITDVILMSINVYIYKVIVHQRRKTGVTPYNQDTSYTQSSGERIRTETEQSTITDRQNGSLRNSKTNTSCRKVKQVSQRLSSRNILNSAMILSTSYVFFSIPEMYRLSKTLAIRKAEIDETAAIMTADLFMNLSFTIVPISIAIRNKAIALEVRKSFRNIRKRCRRVHSV